MVLAAAGAAFIGEPLEGGMLLVLFNLGHVLEERALDRARRSIAQLGEITPRTATVRRSAGEVEVPLDRVEIGETVIVRPGVRLPVDGSVVAGHSAVDQGPVTGESIPVDKAPGDEVFAGTLNGEGVLEVRVTRPARDSTLRRVIEAVGLARARKSPVERRSERITRILVPPVLVADLALVPIGVLGGLSLGESVSRAMVVLVAASPCALALSAPSAVLAGMARAAREGVLVKGGAFLEALARVEALAFDKTGTLTEGKPRVLGIHPAAGIAEDRVLSLAAAVEAFSTHPLASAIVREAQARRLSVPEATGTLETSGIGVRGEVGGNVISVARARAEEEVPEWMREQREALIEDARTVVVVRQGDEVVGLISLADAVRREALPRWRASRRWASSASFCSPEIIRASPWLPPLEPGWTRRGQDCFRIRRQKSSESWRGKAAASA
jgi:Cd2+/Zn2+-exporting ATPase